MPTRRRPRNVGPDPDGVCYRLYHQIDEWSHLGPHEIWEVHPEDGPEGDASIRIDTEGPTVAISCRVDYEDEDDD